MPETIDADRLRVWLTQRLAETLQMPPEQIDPTAPFERLGLESVEATRLIEQLTVLMDRELDVTLAWEHPTVDRLAEHLAAPAAPAPTSERPACASDEPLAIVGVGCRLPGAGSLGELRETLLTGRDLSSTVPAERWDAQRYLGEPGRPGRIATDRGTFITEVDRFDAQFFGISPREAQRMDPQQRIALEVAWEALEDAGIPPAHLAGSDTGVFLGIGSSDYAQLALKTQGELAVDAYAATGNAHSIAANRISHLLDLRGPSLSVDTACSSSLAALHLARRALQAGEVDAALAGAVNLLLTPESSIAFSDARMLAADGRCKTFDDSADGYGRGEGCAWVVLKRLAHALRDGDRIIAVVHGTAVNQDGLTNGLTAPNGQAQQRVIRAALAQAGIEPQRVGYVETHGTGTPLGDPIEVRALAAVYGRGRPAGTTCAIGSAKATMGHLEAAAGMVGLLKAVLCVSRGELYPQAGLRTLNRNIKLDGSGLSIPTEPAAWEDAERLAGVSSFGFGGTNAHAIVGQPPQDAGRTHPHLGADRSHLLVLSARRPEALDGLAARVAERLAGAQEMAVSNACAAAATGRNHMEQRLALVARSGADLVDALRAHLAGRRVPQLHTGSPDGHLQVGFLFSGQGSQYGGMGAALRRREPVFRESLERSDAILRPMLGRPLTELLDERDEFAQAATQVAQPLLVALQLALLELWASWGVRPSAVLGHSVGELSAAVATGVLAAEDALLLAAERGRMMQELSAAGGMIAAFGDAHLVAELVERAGGELALAGVNGPQATTIAGPLDQLQRFAGQLREHAVVVREMRVSGAFHSPLMEPVAEPLRRLAETVVHHDPRIPFFSTVIGRALEEGHALNADYWARQVRVPVLFAPAVQALHQHGCRACLEIGPHETLLTLGRSAIAAEDTAWLASLRRGDEQGVAVLESLAGLHVRGARIDWQAVFGAGRRTSALLPTYPFQRRRHWLAPEHSGPLAAAGRSASSRLLGVRLATVHETYRTTLPAQPLHGDGHAGLYVELALAAVAESAIGGPCSLSALSCRQPPARSGEVAAEVSLHPLDADRRRFSVHAQPAGSGADPADWPLCASAEIVPEHPAPPPAPHERPRKLRQLEPSLLEMPAGLDGTAMLRQDGGDWLLTPARSIDLTTVGGCQRLVSLALGLAQAAWHSEEQLVPASIRQVRSHAAREATHLLIRLRDEHRLDVLALDRDDRPQIELLELHLVAEAPLPFSAASLDGVNGDGHGQPRLDRGQLLRGSDDERREAAAAQLIGLVTDILGCSTGDITADTQLSTLGIDSLRLLEARELIADQLELDIGFEALADAGTLWELSQVLLDMLDERLAAGGTPAR